MEDKFLISQTEDKLKENKETRTLTAGYSFYAPFKTQEKADNPKVDRWDSETQLCYYTFQCLEACLEIESSIRSRWIDIINVWENPKILNYWGSLTGILQTFNPGIKGSGKKSSNLIVALNAQYKDYPEILKSQDMIFNFILQAFNYDKKEPKIIPEKSFRLSFAILLKSYAQFNHIDFTKMDMDKGDVYWVMQNQTDDITESSDRKIRQQMCALAKKYELHLVHEAPIYEYAKLWYVARVAKNNLTVASQIGEYNNVTLPLESNPGTAYNKIHNYDLAMRYKD